MWFAGAVMAPPTRQYSTRPQIRPAGFDTGTAARDKTAGARRPNVALPLSICIPTYNRAALLRETLERLAALPRPVDEVVVSDNASPDATPAVVDAMRGRFARLVYARQPATVGMMPNFQAALSLGTSDLLFPLSDDDALLPDGIARAAALLDADPESVAVYGGYERSGPAEPLRQTAIPRRTGRFAIGDLDAIAETASVLTVPLVRREVFQRHCFLDDTTFGFMRLITQLLACGPIHVLDAPLYRHAGGSPNAQEARVAEPWYQEYLRADWEAFAAAAPGAGNIQTVAPFTASRMLPAYLLGLRAAQNADDPLRERSFLVRYLAHAADAPESQARQHIEQWETTRLIAAVIVRLAERLRVCRGLARVVLEQGRANLPALWPRLQPRLPGVTPLVLDGDALLGFARQPGDFLVAEGWATLERRARDRGEAAIDQVAVLDLVASLRLPGSQRVPLLRGPDQTDHFCLDVLR
jgi:hypothetical protein